MEDNKHFCADQQCTKYDRYNRRDLLLYVKPHHQPATVAITNKAIYGTAALPKSYKQSGMTANLYLIGILVAAAALVFIFVKRCRKMRHVIDLARKDVAVQNVTQQKEVLLQEAYREQVKKDDLLLQEMQLQMGYNEEMLSLRRQIADDMHDSLSSALAALRFYIQDIQYKATFEETRNSLQDIGEEVNSIYNNARKYLHSLKNNEWIVPYNLLDFLNGTAQKFSGTASLELTLDVDEEKIKEYLSYNEITHLYHVICEAITNVIKHAQATKLHIVIGFKVTNCLFRISDNGNGIEQYPIGNDGIGLHSMRKRIEGLKGQMLIDSNSNGTTISGSFPVMLLR